jgi:hypothetical protein
MAEKKKCAQRVIGTGRWAAFHPHQCSKLGILEHGGEVYCKLHHPPSVAARAAAKTKCQHVESYGPCDTGVPAGVKYCRFHAEVTVPRDKWTALLADRARLDRLAQLTEGVQKVYIEPLGWIQLDRVSLDAAFEGEQK